jgi:hypothetical protein
MFKILAAVPVRVTAMEAPGNVTVFESVGEVTVNPFMEYAMSAVAGFPSDQVVPAVHAPLATALTGSACTWSESVTREAANIEGWNKGWSFVFISNCVRTQKQIETWLTARKGTNENATGKHLLNLLGRWGNGMISFHGW